MQLTTIIENLNESIKFLSLARKGLAKVNKTLSCEMEEILSDLQYQSDVIKDFSAKPTEIRDLESFADYSLNFEVIEDDDDELSDDPECYFDYECTQGNPKKRKLQ